ncbi:MAG: DNA cytosine methyltransferase [Synergistaceae bacterium]|nr:DNA cytosine methyltransferase [Synergistaceae bacterium]
MVSLEICAGAGGQALGLEQAGFRHAALVEIDSTACATLRKNRPGWNIIEGDVRNFSARNYSGIDLLAGGVPCPPFSVAGKQLGKDDERELFPEVLRLVRECEPKAVMIENVRGMFDPKFDEYRNGIVEHLRRMGYICFWRIIQSHHYGVPQQRPRAVLAAFKEYCAEYFAWPLDVVTPPTVGQVLYKEMSSNGWEGAKEWALLANGIAPTLVGGSKKHGGPDLGPTRARAVWKKFGIDGVGLADSPPSRGFVGLPRLTVKMTAILQGFPSDWEFVGKKTAVYRQIGNAFPPPVALAIGSAILKALGTGEAKNIGGKHYENRR